MMTMTRKIFVSIAALAICLCSHAQTARELIEQDVTRIGCQHHRYESAYTETPAPRGYKPFYVTHFSRHGSRPHNNDHFTGPLGALARIDSAGLLTDKGRQLVADLETLKAEHEGMWGYLTQVGSLEHQGIAARLYDRCPELFSQKDRDEVLLVSSTVVRCCQSMMNFGTTLKGRAPELKLSYHANGRTDKAVTRAGRGGPNKIYPEADGMAVLDSILHETVVYESAEKSLFTDPVAARAYIPDADPQQFVYDLIQAGVIAQCMDGDLPQIYDYFTIDELYGYFLAKNASTANTHGFTCENREVLRRCGKTELTDILAKADEALSEGSRKVADFRFGHDGGVLPLAFFLRLEKNDVTLPIREVTSSGWYGFENVEMATNIQFIFYRNRKGEVLVKILHNERETSIPSLKTYSYPYYRWSELRPYLVSLTETDCD